MRAITVLVLVLALFMLGTLSGAQAIICDGHSCGGSGAVSYDGQLRDYVYRVTGGAVPPALDSILIGTHDANLAHYSSICMPTGWAYEIIPISRPDYSNPINHSVASPAPDGTCPYTFLFRNVSGAALSPTTPTDFGFDYWGYPHTVDWKVAAIPPVSANWASGVGTGVGPVHGPRCDTLCEIGYPLPLHSLAGRKDNFVTTDGSEPSSPNAGLLAYMQTISGGADPYFDSPTNDRCFGHSYTGLTVPGCVIGAELCFRITPISEGNNDFINIREDAVTPVWGPQIKYLKAWHSGNPADTFWTVGDTLDVCLDLANMPLIKRGTTYYWPTNILATLQDGDMDFLMSDDTKIDYLELFLEVCSDTCWATGDVNGDGTSLTLADLSALINFVNNRVLPNGPLYQCDLNGDDHVDQLDIDIFQCFLSQGMSCFPMYPVPTDCDPDTTVQAASIVIFDLLHTAQGNASLDSAAGKLIVSNIGSTGTDGVTIDLLDTLELWEGVLENPDSLGSLPIGARLEGVFTYGCDSVPDSCIDIDVYETLSQTKMAANQWQLGVVSPIATTYTVEAWQDGWVVFHADSVTTADLGYIVETAKGVYPVGYKGSTSGKPASLVSTGWNFGASPGGVQWTWAAQGVANLAIDELEVHPENMSDSTGPLSSVSILAKNIPSITIADERKADIDTATVFDSYHFSEAFADIASGTELLMVTPFHDTARIPLINEYAGVSSFVPCCHGYWFTCCPKNWSATVANLDMSGTVADGAKLRVLFRGDIDGQPNQPLMALFQTKRAANQWGLGISSNASTYTVKAKLHSGDDWVVFFVDGIAAADLGYITETAKGVYPVGYKGSTSGKPASLVATGWNWGASPDGVQWTWAAQGVANMTIDELEVSWTAPNEVLLGDVSVMVMDIPEFTVTDEVRSDAVKGGDANDDETVNVGDAVYLINYIFRGGPPPPSNGEGDANGDCVLNIGDAVYLVNYIFRGGPSPIINDDCVWDKK